MPPDPSALCRTARRPALPLAVLLAALPLPSAAQVLGDADVIAELMMDYGLRIERKTDDYGDPQIESRIDGTHFTVAFYGCDKGPCESLQLSAGFDMDDPPRLATIDRWNREHRFGKAFLDEEGDPYLQIDVMMSGDGIGRRNFEAILAMWQTALTQFRIAIEF